MWYFLHYFRREHPLLLGLRFSKSAQSIWNGMRQIGKNRAPLELPQCSSFAGEGRSNIPPLNSSL